MPEMTLRASISAYLDEVTVHRNPTTVRTYKGALLGLVKYLEEGAAVNVDTMKPSEVSVDLVVGYFKGLGRLSTSTIEVYFWAIYGWYRFLALNQLTAIDLPKVKQAIQKCIPKRVVNLEEPPNYQDISQIVDYALKLDAIECQSNQKRLRLLRDRALIVTLADTGIEVGIVCRLRRNDIDRENNRLRIVEGSRTSWISVTPRVIKTISDYLDVRLDIDKSVSRSPATLPVFSRHRPSEVGKIVALTPAGVRNIVPGRSLEALGPHYDGSITPKALRHYAVASLLPSLTTLHPRIVRHCKSHFENGQYLYFPLSSLDINANRRQSCLIQGFILS